ARVILALLLTRALRHRVDGNLRAHQMRLLQQRPRLRDVRRRVRALRVRVPDDPDRDEVARRGDETTGKSCERAAVDRVRRGLTRKDVVERREPLVEEEVVRRRDSLLREAALRLRLDLPE